MEHTLIYQGAVTRAGARNLTTLLLDASRSGASSIRLMIASDGGDTTAGIALFSTIGMLPVPVHTHAIGPCSSIAAVILAAGKRRTGVLASSYLIHAARYSEGPRLGQIAMASNGVMSSALKSALGWRQDFIDRFLAETEEDPWTPQEARQHGLIHEIVDDIAINPATTSGVAIPDEKPR